MRAHTTSGTGVVLALAPEPTAVGFVGIRGSAPAGGTAASLVLGGLVAGVGDRVLVLDEVAGAGLGAGKVLLALGVVDIGVGVVRAAAELVLDLPAAGGPEPQPARVRARQVRALAAFVALAVALRRIVRSVRGPPGGPSLPR